MIREEIIVGEWYIVRIAKQERLALVVEDLGYKYSIMGKRERHTGWKVRYQPSERCVVGLTHTGLRGRRIKSVRSFVRPTEGPQSQESVLRSEVPL